MFWMSEHRKGLWDQKQCHLLILHTGGGGERGLGGGRDGKKIRKLYAEKVTRTSLVQESNLRTGSHFKTSMCDLRQTLKTMDFTIYTAMTANMLQDHPQYCKLTI